MTLSRRTTLQWMMTAAALPLARWSPPAMAAGEGIAPPFEVVDWPSALPPPPAAKGYGRDPDLMAPKVPWPLTLDALRRANVDLLGDLLLPPDAHSPGAGALGVGAFVDEWISAPYPDNAGDRKIILEGLQWLDVEATRRFGHGFADSGASDQASVCDDICCLPKSDARLMPAALFFARYRDLTVGGFYTTPEGMRDLQYVGNVALARFDGPPAEVLRKVGLEGENA